MRLLFIFLSTLFAGCAMLPERPAVDDPQSAWVAQQARLSQLQWWDIRGRLALRTSEQGMHASVHWVRERDTHRIDLAGPFGGGRARVTLNAEGAELRDASGKIFRDTSVEELLARVTGSRLPLESLRFWIIGLPVPAIPANIELDAWGRLKTLKQLGWTIQFIEYTSSSAYELPRRLFIERSTGAVMDDAPLEVRVAIEQWNVEGVKPEKAAR